MSREEALINYQVAMTTFRRWFDQGIIAKDELLQIDTMIAHKYGLSSNSIYRLSP